MLYNTTLRTRVRDPVVLAAACARLGLAEPTHVSPELNSANLRLVLLGEPAVPVMIDTVTGLASWQTSADPEAGVFAQLCRLLLAYACEKTRTEARRRGLVIQQHGLPDGSTLITINSSKPR